MNNMQINKTTKRILDFSRILYGLAGLVLLLPATAQAQSTWANSNITATPPTLLDWLTGGPNTQATWTGGTPVSGSGTTVVFFDDTTTALLNTVTPGSSQTANLNTSVFALGTLTFNGKGTATFLANHFESLSGGTLQFSGAAGTINLNAVLNGGTLAFQVGNTIQLGTASSASALTIAGGGGGAFFISGNISELQAGGGSLTKSGASAVTLSGNNTYSGATTVSGGTLRLGSLNALPGGIGAVGGSSALTLNGGVVELGADNFLRNLGSGASQFRITGGNSGFSAGKGAHSVIVNNDASQEIQWGSADFAPSSLVLNGGTALGQLTLENKIDLNGATRTINVSAHENHPGDISVAVLAGVIRNSTGTAGITKSGNGILKLTGVNTFNGPVTVGGSVLAVVSINSIANAGVACPLGQSATAAGLILNGGILKYTGSSASSDRSFTLNASSAIDASGTGALNLTSTATPAYGGANSARTLTLTGFSPDSNTLAALLANNGTGAISLTKAGAGTWVLSNTNTFTGVVTLTGGILSISSIANGGSASPLGQSTSAAANLKLGANTTLKYIGPVASSDRSFTINGANAGDGATLDASGTGALNLTSTATPAYNTTAQTRTLTLSGGNTDTNSLSALLANNGGAAVTVVKAGKGKWVLNGPAVNTYTGGTTIKTGTLELDFGNLTSGYADLINSGSVLTLGGGTLSLKGHASNASSQIFTNIPVFSSQSGSGISLAGASGMTLTLSNTWTRNAGSTMNVTLGSGGTLTSSPTVANTLVVGNGNIAFATVGGTDWAKVSGGNVVAFAGGDYNTTFPDSGATSTVNYSLTDNGSVTVSETANTLKINTSTTGQSLAITAGQTLTLNAGGLLFTGAHDYSITGGTLKGSGGTQKELAVHQFGSGNLTVDSVIANNSTATVLTKTGTGTLTLGAANTHSGNTYAGGGGSLVLKNQLALQSSPLFLNNCTLVFDSSVTTNAFTLAGLSSDYAGPGYDLGLTNNAGAAIVLTVTNAANLTYAGDLSGSGSLIKSGSGQLTLSGNNTFTGGITVNGGKLVAQNTGRSRALSGGGSYGDAQITVNSGGNLTIVVSSHGGTVTLNGGTMDCAGNFPSTWLGPIVLQSTSTFQGTGSHGGLYINGVVSGTGGLIKGASTLGRLFLLAASTFSGPTRLNDGFLYIVHPLALQNSTLDAANSLTGNASGGLKILADTLTLGGLSGTKNLAALFATSVGGPATSRNDNPGFDTAYMTPLGGYRGLTALTLNPGTGVTNTYSGSIADGAPGMTLIKTGAGTQTLAGVNTYTGPTTIKAGTLALGASGTLDGDNDVVLAGGTLDMGSFNNTLKTLAVTGNSTLALGSGNLSFADSSAVAWTGNLTLTGTLGATTLRFGGLTADQLKKITIDGKKVILDGAGYVAIMPAGLVISFF